MIIRKLTGKRDVLLALAAFSLLAVSGLMGCGKQNAAGTNGMKADMSIEEAAQTAEEDVSAESNDTNDEEYNDVTYSELSEGDAAPDFTAELVGGGSFTLSENKDKVVLINLWATWCGPCVGEMPAFERLYKEYGDDLKIVGVNCVEDKDTVDTFVKDNGYTFPIAYDENGAISGRYPTQGIPYTLIIGKDGIIKNIYLGADSEDIQYKLYKEAIDTAINE